MYLQVTGCSFFRCDMPQEKHRELLCFCNLLYCLIRICLSKKQLKQQLSKGHKYLSINASAPEFKQSFKKKKSKENARVRWLPYHMSWWGRGSNNRAHRPAQDTGMLTDVSLGRFTHSPTPGTLFHWIGPYFSLKFIMWCIHTYHNFSGQENHRWQ